MGALILPASGVVYIDTAPIIYSVEILKEAARWRANTNLKTPDAIHAATALAFGCVQFISNDPFFRRVTTLNVIVLKAAATA